MSELLKLQNGSDVRGVALKTQTEEITINEQIAYNITRSFARLVKVKYIKKEEDKIFSATVGMDSRLSGPALKQAVLGGFADEGFTVYDAALTSTPAIFMSTIYEEINADCGIMITASHLPYNRNGMKFFLKEGGINKDLLKEVLLNAQNTLPVQNKGSIKSLELTEIYSDYLTDIIKKRTKQQRPFEGKRIIVDAGNGAGGFFTSILTRLGANTEGSLYLEPDGMFPNHIPNPENKAVMKEFSKKVLNAKADLGIIFDTDVDRAAFVDKSGRIIAKNALVALMSVIVVGEREKSVIVTDSVTSTALSEFIASIGGIHHRFKRGYKNVIDEAIRLNDKEVYTPIAIETSGHCALKENFFLDDGAYMAVKILIFFAEMTKKGKILSDAISMLREPVESVEVRGKILKKDFREYGEVILDAFKTYAKNKEGWKIEVPSYEGVRVLTDRQNGDGWILMRLSLHDPQIVINMESDKEGGIAQMVREIELSVSEFDAFKIDFEKDKK
jgi:phosphomannomutase